MPKNDRPAFIDIKAAKLRKLTVTNSKAVGDVDFIRNTAEIDDAHIARNEHIVPPTKQSEKSWYERPVGIVTLAIISGLVVAWIAYHFGWL